MNLNNIPSWLNPRGLHIHPDWIDSPDWPTFQKVLDEWCGPIKPDIVKAVENGQFACITGVNLPRLKALRKASIKNACHVSGFLVLVPCHMALGGESDEVVDDAQTCDATGPEAELPGASGDDDSENNGTD